MKTRKPPISRPGIRCSDGWDLATEIDGGPNTSPHPADLETAEHTNNQIENSLLERLDTASGSPEHSPGAPPALPGAPPALRSAAEMC